MQTGSIDTTTSAAATTASSSNTLGQSAFLQLLETELQNQDPTSAQDPNTMITQMAQFSSLEQQTDTNTLLTSMQNQVSALFQAQSSSLIGTNVQVTSSSLDLSGGTASVGISLPSAAAQVSLNIAAADSSGNSVAATTTSSATVTAVNFSNGTIMVTAGGQQYPLSAINQISN